MNSVRWGNESFNSCMTKCFIEGRGGNEMSKYGREMFC